MPFLRHAERVGLVVLEGLSARFGRWGQFWWPLMGAGGESKEDSVDEWGEGWFCCAKGDVSNS